MSSADRRFPPLEVRERAICMCAGGERCSSFAPGHALHLIQARLAQATPSEWIDAVVERADAATGEVDLLTLSGERVAVWSGAGAADRVSVGEPVALHGRYDVLAVGAARFNLLRVP